MSRAIEDNNDNDYEDNSDSRNRERDRVCDSVAQGVETTREESCGFTALLKW